MRNRLLKCLIASAAILTTLPTTVVSAENDKDLVISFEESDEKKVYNLVVGEEVVFLLEEDSRKYDITLISEDDLLSAVYDAEINAVKVTASEEFEGASLHVVRKSDDVEETFTLLFTAEKEEAVNTESIENTETITEKADETDEFTAVEEAGALTEETIETEETSTEEALLDEGGSDEQVQPEELVHPDGFIEIDGKHYYYENNVLLKGLQTLGQDNKKYYFDNDGVLLTGFQKTEDGKTYYFKDGQEPAECFAATGWEQIKGKWYFFDKEGVMKTGWVSDNGKDYYFNSDGSMVTGFKDIEGKRYYFYLGGSMAKDGWKSIDGKWYFFNKGGSLKKDVWFQDTNGKWYYLNKDGSAAVGWKQINGKWYYFNKSGSMAVGWKLVDGKWYYLNKGGSMKSDTWYQENGKWYFFNKSGSMAVGWKQVNGKWYYFYSGGSMASGGWIYVNNKWYYLNSSGSMRGEGWMKYKNKWYYLTKSGAAKTGWLKDDRCWYYFNENAAMVSNTTLTINGKSQKFAPDGEWIDWNYLYDLSYGFQIRVNRARCVLTVYGKDYQGDYTIPVWAVTVSVGMDETPTPLGWSTINSKHRWYYYKDDDCWLQYSQFFAHGTKMMHSEAYFSQDPGNMAVGEYYKLGRQASHGCIRMPVIYIKWIYDNCPIGTEVLVYDDWDYAGPYGKPAVPKITNGSAWDPTDPDPRSPYNN